MKNILFILFSVNIVLFPSNTFAWHEIKVTNETIANLGGVFAQIFIYEENCKDHKNYSTISERLPNSSRFNRYNDEVEHLTERQNLAYERGGAGVGLAVASGKVSCDSIAQIIWEWFGEK
jgi:hypothetical protein